MAEEGKSPARPFLSRVKRGGRRPSEFRKWITASWPTLVMVLFIFILALFVRSYFGYPSAHDNGNLVSGGSDSYYWERIINYSAQTGKQLYHDPLLNFPDGLRNPRPPLFSMSVVVPAILTQKGFPSLGEALGWYLLWAPAFWGALTVVPMYLLGKETFGRRAGLAAAFLFAVMPSAVQRSVLSDADHDAIILFFIVLALYFLLKALKVQEPKKWVQKWSSFSSVKTGLRAYFRNNTKSMLFGCLAGVAYSAVIMIWVGFGYVTVLILIYYVFQILLNKMRGVDSLGVTVIIAITLGVGFLISFPVYFYQSLMATRFDIPFYLFMVSMVFGGMFVVTRDHPWTITFPFIGILVVLALFVINLFNPALVQAMLTGEGYFSTSKLYSTIAEAKAPVFSALALGFGMITFFMSLAGLVWAVMKIPKNTSAQYIFITVWLAEAIFMAMTSARFMFNGTPAFALSAGWILVIIVDKLDFNSMRRSIVGASGSYLHIIKKGVKVRHVLGALFLAFMVVLPNVWYSIDAGIPADIKTNLDKEIYNSIPKVLRPSGYDVTNGSNWYLGAFGYSLPLPQYYFPAAWSWFASQDANVTPEAAKPAFVAWWDYGFEAIYAGQHPAVADNFQDGYHTAGNALMAQGEADAIAIFAYRIIQAGIAKGGATETGIVKILEKYGVDSAKMQQILFGPGEPIIQTVLSDASVYGPMASDLDATNARIVAARVQLTSIGIDNLVSLYGDLVDFTGWNIRYFMVDSRMFPSSGTNTGIFYAPALLSDRRITGGSTPIDFYNIQAVTTTGQTVDIQNLTAHDQVTQYNIVYQPMFYDSMFYKAFVGISGADVGLSNNGIPGLSTSMSRYTAMPGWNMTHFVMVYRTAYYNPFPASQVSQHRDAWTAMSYDEAEKLKAEINAGTAVGVVDDSSYTYYSAGACFLEYYKGAYVNGTLTTDVGYPVGGVRVTMQDKYGIPHGSVLTDANGSYSLLAPPGNDSLAFSTGNASNPSLVGTNQITTMKFNVTDDQAMRVREDLNHDGILDYMITKNFVMRSTSIGGKIYWDMDHDKNYTAGTDKLVTGSLGVAREQYTNRTFAMNTTSGTFSSMLPPGVYDFNILVNGAVISMGRNVTATAGGQATVNMPIEPCSVTGTAFYPNGTVAADVSLQMNDLDVNFTYNTTTDSEGRYAFNQLITGNYSLSTTVPGQTVFDTFLLLASGASAQRNITLAPAVRIDYVVLKDGKPAPYAAWILSDVYNPKRMVSGFADEFGHITLTDIPAGAWTLYASYYSGTAGYAAAVLVDTQSSGPLTGVLPLGPAAKVQASVTSQAIAAVVNEYVNFALANGACVAIPTDANGMVSTILPIGTYKVTVASATERGIYSGTATVSSQQTKLSFSLSTGANITGKLTMVTDAVAGISPTDNGTSGELKFTDPSGYVYTTTCGIDGSFSVIVPLNVLLIASLGNPGYSHWSTTVEFSQSLQGYSLVASPDNVTVCGVLTSQGVGVRGALVSFLPSLFLGAPVHAVTGAGGAYSVSLPPSSYKVEVNQNADPMGAQRYVFDAQETFRPSGAPTSLNIHAEKKVLMFGEIAGGSTSTRITIQGLENRTLDLTTLNYSVYLLPGNYNIYATSTISGLSFANVSSVSLIPTARQYDLQLSSAHALKGVVLLGSTASTKAVIVQATLASGAVVKTTSSSLGAYSLELPSGSYTVTYLREDYLVAGQYTLSVEYFAQNAVTISTADVTVNPNLALRLDNATLSGTIVAPNGLGEQATVTLIPISNIGEPFAFMTAVNGSFSQSVQPGEYTVYVSNPVMKTAALGQVQLFRKGETKGVIPLQYASYLRVKAQVASAGARVVLYLSNGSTQMQLPTDSQGIMQILLPPGQYSISSTAYRTENTLNVTYSLSTTITMGKGDLFQTLEFVRGTKQTLATSWSRTMEQTAAPNHQVNYVITIDNTGNIADTYFITYTGSGLNVTYSPSELSLGFGVNNKTTVVAHVSPTNKTLAGEQVVPTLVRSLNLATVSSSVYLYVNVTPVHKVAVTGLSASVTVSSLSTITEFNVTNMGNVQDKFALQVSNVAILETLGWKAAIINPDNKSVVTNVTLGAFAAMTLEVKFTQTRASADPTAQAFVMASSVNAASVSSYGAVPVILPDLVLPQGSLTAVGPGVAYVYDMVPLYTDIGLLAAIVALMVMFLILRKKKGFGGAKGGAKK